MQTLTYDYDIQEFEPKVQHFAPMIENLSANERFALIKLIMDMPFGMNKKKADDIDNAHKRFNRHPNAIIMADNFDDHLGDDFWLGKDK